MAQSSMARFAKTLSGAVAVATVLMSCDNGPSDVLKLEILGPSSLSPGASATYSVMEHRAGGSTRLAEFALWTSSNPSVLEITRSGVATARSLNGETTLSVKASGLGTVTEVVVLPEGTFRLVGRVTDVISGIGLAEARVEVPGGPVATTEISGAYRLYGVPANPELRVTRHGYGAVVEPIQLTAHSTRDFWLLADNIVSYAGHYTLTMEAACTAAQPSPLRPELRRRSYAAQILQQGASLEVRLSGADFSGDRFRGNVTAGGAMFVIHRDYEYADLTEVLGYGSTLTIYGTATTRGSPSGLSGPLGGGFQQFTPPPNNGFCPASTFSLVPR